MNAYQNETLHTLIARGEIKTAREVGLDIEIDEDGSAWAIHCGYELVYSSLKGGWVVIKDLGDDLDHGTKLDEAVIRAALYAADDEDDPRTPADRLLAAVLSL